MKVAIFGCSFTYGIKQVDHWHNWVIEFAKIRPDLIIDNYSNSGSSLRYSVELIDALHTEYDKVILQLTLPGRFTYKLKEWNHPTELLSARENHRWISTSAADKYYRFVNPWTEEVVSRNALDDNQFVKEYYGRVRRSELLIEHFSLISYVKGKTSFMYSHYSDYIGVQYENIPVVEEHLSSDQLQSYVADESGHFSVDGNKWVANWVNSQIDF